MGGRQSRIRLATVETPRMHGSDESQEQLVHGAPFGCSPLSGRPGKWLREMRPLCLLDSEVVSPPALVADERWVILSWENARVPRSGQSSVGWVQSVAFKFRVPYICGRAVHVCHLQKVFGASILMHFNGFSAPLL